MRKKKTLLIYGVLGHIGFQTAITALKNNYQIVGLYNSKLHKKEFKILKKLKVKLIKNDFNNVLILKKIILKYKIRNCLYAAAVSHEIYAKKNPEKTLNVNSTGVENILSVVDKKFKFIYLSTGSVYQDIKNKKKIYENQVPTPISLYAGTKRLGEIIVDFYYKNFNKNCTTLRISWVYGPPIISKHINVQRGPIPYYVYQFFKGKFLFNLKSGKDFRASFTYVDDVINTIMYLLSVKKFKSNIYNLGTGKNNSITELFKILNKFRKIKFRIRSGVYPWSNSSVMRGPLLSKFNYIKAKVDLYLGLKKYLQWLKNNA